MKCVAALSAAFLCAYMIITCLPVHGEEEIYDQTIRLHVLANSDSEADQAQKLRVRDGVLTYLEQTLSQSSTYGDALSAALVILWGTALGLDLLERKGMNP